MAFLSSNPAQPTPVMTQPRRTMTIPIPSVTVGGGGPDEYECGCFCGRHSVSLYKGPVIGCGPFWTGPDEHGTGESNGIDLAGGRIVHVPASMTITMGPPDSSSQAHSPSHGPMGGVGINLSPGMAVLLDGNRGPDGELLPPGVMQAQHIQWFPLNPAGPQHPHMPEEPAPTASADGDRQNSGVDGYSSGSLQAGASSLLNLVNQQQMQ